MDDRVSAHRVAGDSGLLALALVARIHKVHVDVGQLQASYGHHNRPCSRDDIVRAARSLNFQAKKLRAEPGSISPECLPAIVRDKDGGFFVFARTLGRSGEHCRYLIQRPDQLLPDRLSNTQLKTLWTNEVVLLKPRREKPAGYALSRTLGWRIPLLARYRKRLHCVYLVVLLCQTCSVGHAQVVSLSTVDILEYIEVQLAWRQVFTTWLSEGESGITGYSATLSDSQRAKVLRMFNAHRDDIAERILLLTFDLENTPRKSEEARAIERRIDVLLEGTRQRNSTIIKQLAIHRHSLMERPVCTSPDE